MGVCERLVNRKIPVRTGGLDGEQSAQSLLLQLLKVTVLAVVRLGGGFYKLEKLLQRLAFGSFEVKSHADTKGRIALDDDAVEDQALHPNLSAGDPEANLHVRPTLHWSDGFHVAPAHTGVRQVAPDRGFGAIHFQFHRDEASDSRKTAAILSPARCEDVRLKWRCRRGHHWSRSLHCHRRRSDSRASDL